MYNLIYISSAVSLYSNEELIDILTTSRLNNTRLKITGLLLYNEGSILQVLEGEEEVIHATYDTISRDNRHKGLIKMIDFGIKERNFIDWSMGFKQVSNNDWSQIEGYFDLANKEKFKLLGMSENKDIITLIKSFANVSMSSILQ